MNKLVVHNAAADADGITKVECGPFTWVKRPIDVRVDRSHPQEEVWEVQTPTDIGMTSFVVKNYGGKPSNKCAFTGWRLVSGGPFSQVGGWTNRDDAIIGVTPFLIKFYRERAADLIAKANKIIQVVSNFNDSVSAGDHLGGRV